MRTSVEKVRPESNNFACLGKIIKEKAISKKREYDEEYKVQAIELAKNLSGNPMESRKLTGKHTNLMIF